MDAIPFPPFFWTAYTLSNVGALTALWSSRKYPRLTRLFFFLLFGGAACFNTYTALDSPWVYQDFADTAVQPYKWFILGPFAAIMRSMVVVIAAGQALIALTMFFRGRIFRWGCWGGILFGIGVAPLGLNAAFPATLIMALAFYRLLHRNDPPLATPGPDHRVMRRAVKSTHS